MQADYVIVGAGSAGCAMAYRLSEAGASVLVIEYGGSDAGPFIQMPAALSYPMNMSRYDWGYSTEPDFSTTLLLEPSNQISPTIRRCRVCPAPSQGEEQCGFFVWQNHPWICVSHRFHKLMILNKP